MMNDTPLTVLHKTVQSFRILNYGTDSKPWFEANLTRKFLGLKLSVFYQLAEDEILLQEEPKDDGWVSVKPIINSSGLYKLMMRSRRPGAAYFQDWVTQTVLPCIYQHGIYLPEADGFVGKTVTKSIGSVVPGFDQGNAAIAIKPFRSNSSTGHALQDWVTREVLPSIYKERMYVYGQEKVRTGEISDTCFLDRVQAGAKSICAARRSRVQTAN